MDKKSKILIFIFIIVIFLSVFLTYRRAFVERDFEVIISEESEEVFE